MESAKEKAIKEAWAEHYDFVKVNLESDGSFWVYEYQTELYEWCKKNTKRIITTKKATRFIPFNIVGVHDNNGWTRIESEADLPTEESLYKVVLTTGEYDTYPFMKGDEEYWINTFSHYEKIEYKKPIY